MTMKPKARRFRLRLNDDTGGALPPEVSPRVAAPAGRDRGPAMAAEALPDETAMDQPARAAARAADRASPAPREPAQAEPVRPQQVRPQPPRPQPPRPQREPGGAQAETPDSAGAQPAPSGLRQTAMAMAAAKLREAAARVGGTGDAPDGTARADRADRADTGDRPRGETATRSQNADTPGGSAEVDAEIEAIRAEELTGRQLRMALRVAQKHGIKATSGLEAVRLLRRQGIDPFEQSALLDIVRNNTEPAPTTGRALTTTTQPPLPKAYRQPGTPATVAPPVADPAVRAQEIKRIQGEIVRRRRRRLALLGSRLAVFVLLPTLLAAWYFYAVATPLYATNSEFVIQQADSASAPSAPGGLGGLLGGAGLSGAQDSVTVQSYLQSREAMHRLDQDHGFKAHFQDASIDPIRRLAADATDEAAYRLYRKMVQISFDPTEGIIKLEVIAADPETSERFARALIQYAEEQVDQLTQRLRENQMRDAQESFELAEARMIEAQMRVLELQENFQILSSEVEITLLTQQITTLEGQLNQERLSLEDLMANSRPNMARVQQVERRINALETQINALRSSLTQGSAGGASLARVQREMVMAESDVATRQLLLGQAMQQMEAARVEANRQVRYLSMGVSPIAPDEATYPRKFENTALAFLICAGVYLMLAMTVSILREQVTS